MKKNIQIILVVVVCAKCGSKEIRKYGKTKTGEQKYLCENEKCPKKIFKLEYRYNACKAGIRAQIIQMSVNASGIRDIARVLKVSPTTVISVLNKHHQNYKM